MSRFSRITICTLSVLFLTVAGGTISLAQSGDYDGWELNSEYNKLYNPKERDSIKGHIAKFVKVTPLPGMSPGTGLVLDEGGGDMILVHICPQSFAKGREIGLKRGEWVKIKGAWADIGDETVFIAAKIKKDEGLTFKTRLTSDGTPFWTMSPERLEKERASD